VATTACARLVTVRRWPSSRDRPLLAAALAGWVLMVHDWKDRSIWFQRGRGPSEA
jgi:hypothetical protein